MKKLSFEQLARFYGALTELETHYGKMAVMDAVDEMAKKLDSEKGKSSRMDQLKMDLPFEPSPEELKGGEKKKRKPKRTQKRIHAEEMARAMGYKLDKFLVIHYYKYKYKQKEIADLLDVRQETVSSWIREIPQQTIQRLLGETNGK